MIVKIFILFYISVFIYASVRLFKNPTSRSKMGFFKFLVMAFSIIAILLAVAYFNGNIVTRVDFSVYSTDSMISSTTTALPVCYGIMFDAGSTGSRLHVFRFNISSKADALDLDDSLFVSTKPGLSSYAHDPKEGAESLKSMLEEAKRYIPESHWSATPIALKATAGLRLLSKEVAQSLLSEVEMLFRKYPFDLKDGAISILEGEDEGLFSWFTVNYLNGSLKNISETFGVLDLGGGSTQITFFPKKPLSSNEDVVNVKLFSESCQMYTHSYLGLGMMSARFKILGGTEQVSGEIGAQQLQSSCLPYNYVGTWNYRGQTHDLRSTANSTNILSACKLETKDVVDHYKVYKPPDSNFFAISFFFDIAVQEGIVQNEKVGATVQVEVFALSAEKVCRSTNSSDPFRCLNLIYASSLLTDGYGFSSTQTLTLRREIRDFEIAWALGAMFQVYGKFNKAKKSRSFFPESFLKRI